MSDRCPCGGIILADTEDWKVPLCANCSDKPFLTYAQRKSKQLVEENYKLQSELTVYREALESLMPLSHHKIDEELWRIKEALEAGRKIREGK